MIVVNAVIKTTEEDIVALHSAIRHMETTSRAEQGCEDYTFSVELNEPNTLRVTEKWRRLEDLQAHIASPHMAEFQQLMGSNPPASVEIKFYEVREIQPF